jgi:hypothetical protein
MSLPRTKVPRAKALCLLVSAATLLGCGKSVDRLQPLSDDEADQHEAPHADGSCKARAATDAWVWSSSPYLLRERENIRVVVDPCGNTIVASSQHGTTSPVTIGTRLYRDGAKDENYSLPNYQGAQHFDLEVDEYGNALVLSDRWLQVVTAAGRMHAGIPDSGLGVTGDSIARLSEDVWLVDGIAWAGVSLPSGDQLWTAKGDGWIEPYQRTTLMVPTPGEIIATVIGEAFASGSTDLNATSVYYVMDSVLNPEFFERSPDFWGVARDPYDLSYYAETALLAVNSEQRYLGTTAYTADPATHIRITCRESMLINIDDEEWKPDPLDFCGALEALELGDDGSLYSLWTVPVETLDAAVHPFEAEATLVRHDPAGAETGRWVLTDTFGRLAQDGSGAMDMKLVDGGQGAIIGALVGGPWNGRFFTDPSLVVARVPLE